MAGGGRVLAGIARVLDRHGADVSAHFVAGAHAALAVNGGIVFGRPYSSPFSPR